MNVQSTPHPNPQLARRGVKIQTPVAAPTPLPADPRTSTRSPLIDEFPDCLVVSCSWRSAMTFTPDVTPPTTLPQWWPLMSINIGEDFRQDVMLEKICYELMPCDTQGLGTNSNLIVNPWGLDAGLATGNGAVVVVGQDLPVNRPNRGDNVGWSFAPFEWAAFIPAGDAQATLPREGLRKFLDIQSFPPGRYTDVPAFKYYRETPFGKLGRRLSKNDRLDVALVLAPNTIPEPAFSAGDECIVGHIKVDLVFGTTNNLGQFDHR